MNSKGLHKCIILVIVLSTFPFQVDTSCVDAPTSEGPRTLANGEKACAALDAGETENDKGKRFVFCSNSYLYTQYCGFGTRFDVKIDGCNWPDQATCAFPEPSTTPTTTTTSTTTTTTTPTTITTTTITTPTTTTATPTITTTTPTTTTTTPTTTTTTTPTTTTTTPTTTTTTPITTTTTAPTTTPTTTTTTPATATTTPTTATTTPTTATTTPTTATTTPTTTTTTSTTTTTTSTTTTTTPATTTTTTPSASTENTTSNAPSTSTTPTTPTTTTTPTATPTTTTSTNTINPNEPCSSSSCQMPNCWCLGAEPSLPKAETPMFIMLTFDDAVTPQLYDNYFKSLLVDNSYSLFNPNGCPIRAAFYFNHNYTDYTDVQTLADAGNEFASHTITHSLPTGDMDSDYAEMAEEIDGLRDLAYWETGDLQLANNIQGFRAPYLRVAHDVQFDVLQDYYFVYDTSIVNVEIFQGNKPFWPFTLDYVIPSDKCPNLPCPTKSYPGLWEVPINGWIGSDNYSCGLIDGCTVGDNVFTASEQEWYEFYSNNFGNYFYPNKVPMQMFTHGSMFIRSPNSYSAMWKWFQDVLATHDDVWLVTPLEVLEWMIYPLTNEEMIALNWGC